jgi:hypothetical protein
MISLKGEMMMKKISKFSLVIVISLCIMLATTAFFVPKINWPDPVVTPAQAGMTFTATVLDQWQLPGTEVTSSGGYEPVGFVTGQMQFGGSGLQLADLPAGKTAQICFSFPLYRYDWRGAIYQWDGSKWLLMATTTTQLNDEAMTTTACAQGAGNGTYALIMGFHGVVQYKLK